MSVGKLDRGNEGSEETENRAVFIRANPRNPRFNTYALRAQISLTIAQFWPT